MTHVLRNYLDVQGLISIRVSGGENSDAKVYKVHPKIKLYKYGVAQPGVLCVKPDASLLYAWAIEPTLVGLPIMWQLLGQYLDLLAYFLLSIALSLWALFKPMECHVDISANLDNYKIIINIKHRIFN